MIGVICGRCTSSRDVRLTAAGWRCRTCRTLIARAIARRRIERTLP